VWLLLDNLAGIAQRPTIIDWIAPSLPMPRRLFPDDAQVPVIGRTRALRRASR
jgi:hypothetical protein